MDLRDLSSDNVEGNIDIGVNFTVIECDCGGVNNYNQEKCTKCGEVLEPKEQPLDPCVGIRRAKFSAVLSLIAIQDNIVKELKRNFWHRSTQIDSNDNVFDLIQNSIATINHLIDKNLFLNVSFHSDEMDSIDVQLKISEIEEHLATIYDILKLLLTTDVSPVWRNPFRRFLKSVEGYLSAVKNLVYAITAETVVELKEKQKVAQSTLDCASNDIKAFSYFLRAKTLEFNFDSFSHGEVNRSVFMGMMLGGEDFIDIQSNLNFLHEGIYDYFRQFLDKPIDYYRQDKDFLFSLAPFRLMGMLSFDEVKFFNKINVVNNLLEKAYKENKADLKEFMFKFIDKYVYASNILLTLSQDFAFCFGNNIPIKLLIKKATGWYKDLAEGVFRDVSSIIIKSQYINNKKTIDNDRILEWMGFPDKLSIIQQNTKILTEGVEKILRHSEAHVDYVINEKEETIIFRNKKFKSGSTQPGTIETLEYNYVDFLNLVTLLAESIYSVIAGLNIFLANHSDELNSLAMTIDKEFEKEINQDISDLVFPLIGVIITSKIYDFVEEGKQLILKGTSLERVDREILSKCISCCVPISIADEDINSIQVEVTDINEKLIGSVQVVPEYLRMNQTIPAKFRNYNALLVLETSKINYLYNLDSMKRTDSFGSEFVRALMILNLPIFEKIKDLESLLIVEYKNHKPQLQEILEELTFVKNLIEEYSKLVVDCRLLDYVKSIIIDLETNINKVVKYEAEIFKLNEAYIAFKKNALKYVELGQLIEENGKTEDKGKIEEFLRFKKKLVTTRTGRNEPCPCGSGKKYKKCCLH